ncbi:MAG: non-hydrolyzing UDP-N-acetylglucosamine 2-epimerase [Sphingomicrobium sp.]
MGTRPEAIKLAPVAHALAERGLRPSLVFTGQHASLRPSDHRLGEYPAVHLGCPGEEDPNAHVRKVETALAPLLADRPDLLIVQGDTSSALGGARAAFAAGVPVAHVEAGLRTRDRALPWPEEEYRAEIDARGDLLFAPTELAAFNLVCERVPGTVHVTGNTGIDALLAVLAELGDQPARSGTTRSILVTCHRRESWGAGLVAVASAVRELASDKVADVDVIVPPNAHVAAAWRQLLDGCPNVRLLEPCEHRELIARMRAADLILSDSGGMQEEAPVLGVPLLILREKTERPEGIATGNMVLVGTDASRIAAEVRRLLANPAAYEAMSRPAFPYGDGHAAPRIAAIIAQWVGVTTSLSAEAPGRMRSRS